MFLTALRRLFGATFVIATLLAGTTASAKDPIANLLNNKAELSSNEDEYLKPDEAFQFSAEMKAPDTVTLSWVIAPHYYLYRDRIKVSLDGETKLVQLGAPQFPAGQTKQDEYFGEQVVYHELLDVPVPVARAADAQGDFKIKVQYQGCAEAGLCYNPINKFVTLTLPSASAASTLDGKSDAGGGGGGLVSQQDSLAAALQGDSVLYALGLFFVAGLALSLTPCVLPMIPILSGIIVGQGDKITRGKSFSLAFTYVQGMALTYAGVGAVFALAFKQAPQAFFQQPWIVTVMALLFIALSFAMFGFYTLQMPSFLQTKFNDASNKQKSGTYVGTFVMGALSALVVTACVAPAIVAALTVIIQSRQVFRGALALYCSGIGMGVPLLLVGASAGDLLPRAGAWMDTVKQLFGVVFLALAVYIAQPLIPSIAAMLLWATIAVVTGYWLVTLMHGSKHAPAVLRGFGLVVLVYGIALLLGGLGGRTDPLQPLAGFAASGGATGAPVAQHASLPFKRIKTVAELDGAIAAANAQGNPVMLDFLADWCVSCKEMEKYTFSDPRVAAALNNAVLLQADVTANDDDDQALLKRFGIFGPPSIMFFVGGEERKNYRVVGYMKADQFHQHVADAFAG